MSRLNLPLKLRNRYKSISTLKYPRILALFWMTVIISSSLSIYIGTTFYLFNAPLSQFADHSRWSFLVAVLLAVSVISLLLAQLLGNRLRFYFYLLSAVIFTNLWVLLAHNVIYMFDDSFYYLEIAHNILTHQWSTFDNIATTNGYHPLWIFFLVALQYFLSLFNVTDPMPIIDSVQATQIIMLAGITILIYLHLVRYVDPTLSVLLTFGYLAMPLTTDNSLSGMETALLTGLALWSHYTLTATSPEKPSKGLFISIFLITLTRIEVGLAWGGICFLYIYATTKRKLLSFWIGISTALGLIINISYNYTISGLPSSYAGEIKRIWAARAFAEFLAQDPITKFYSLVQALLAQTMLEYPVFVIIRVMAWFKYIISVPEDGAFIYVILTGVVLTLFLGLVIWQWNGVKTFFISTKLWPFVLFSVCLTVIYKVSLFTHTSAALGGPDYQGQWYHQLFNVSIYFIIVALFLAVYYKLPKKRLQILSATVGVIILSFLGNQVITARWGPNRPLDGNPSYSAIRLAIDQGIQINCVWHPNGGRDGFMLSSQTITVVNGDGLVNSPEYFEHITKYGEAASYLKEKGCLYFVAPYDDPAFKGPVQNTGVVQEKNDAIFIQRGYDIYYGKPGSVALWKLRTGNE